jgi:hypothetical protein
LHGRHSSVGSYAAHLDSQVQRSERPRVELVLCRGGALGLAHIGVLRYFEEHHIPIGVAGVTPSMKKSGKARFRVLIESF